MTVVAIVEHGADYLLLARGRVIGRVTCGFVADCGAGWRFKAESSTGTPLRTHRMLEEAVAEVVAYALDGPASPPTEVCR